MDTFGPHFDPSLIGPDGRLTRLHKGGGDSERLQMEANDLARKNARAQRRATNRANNIAAAASKRQANVAKRQLEALIKAQQQAAARMDEGSPVIGTQVIEDEEALMRARIGRGGMGAGLGVSARAALSRSGLGGGSYGLG